MKPKLFVFELKYNSKLKTVIGEILTLFNYMFSDFQLQ